MLLQQKEALWSLFSGVLFILVKALFVRLPGLPNLDLTLLLLTLFIVSLWLIRHGLGAKFSKLDERDKTIRYQAALIAIHGLLAVVMIYALALYLKHLDTMQVPLGQVLNLAYYAWISLYVFWTAAILILYRTGSFNV